MRQKGRPGQERSGRGSPLGHLPALVQTRHGVDFRIPLCLRRLHRPRRPRLRPRPLGTQALHKGFRPETQPRGNSFRPHPQLPQQAPPAPARPLARCPRYRGPAGATSVPHPRPVWEPCGPRLRAASDVRYCAPGLFFALPGASVSIHAIRLSPSPLPHLFLTCNKLLRHCFGAVDLLC